MASVALGSPVLQMTSGRAATGEQHPGTKQGEGKNSGAFHGFKHSQ